MSDYTITRKRALEFLETETGGRIFSATFTRNDGILRKMNCRRGVKKYLNGGTLPYDAKEKGMLPVWDLQKKSYRMINLKNLLTFAIGGVRYTVV